MFSGPEMVNTVRGRRTKFTADAIEQIKTLVERGTSREDIAATIGATVGSLQVTCSRLGISLRRSKAARASVGAAAVSDEPKPEGNGKHAGAPIQIAQRTQLALIIRRGDRERRIELNLPDDVVTRIALEATFGNETFAAIIARILVKAYKK